MEEVGQKNKNTKCFASVKTSHKPTATIIGRWMSDFGFKMKRLINEVAMIKSKEYTRSLQTLHPSIHKQHETGVDWWSSH